MPKNDRRAMRIAELVKREMSDLLMTFSEDARIAQTVVTDARSKHHAARVKVYVYPALHSSCKAMLEGLDEHKALLRKQLGARLQLRYVPDIEFVYDDVIDSAQRIEHALEKVSDNSS